MSKWYQSLDKKLIREYMLSVSSLRFMINLSGQENYVRSVRSLKKKNKELVVKVNLFQTEVNHLLESYFSHLHDNAHKKTRNETTTFSN